MYRQPRNVVSSCDNAKLVIGVNELSVEPGETGYIEKYERVLDFELPLQIPSSGLKGGGCSVLTVRAAQQTLCWHNSCWSTSSNTFKWDTMGVSAGAVGPLDNTVSERGPVDNGNVRIKCKACVALPQRRNNSIYKNFSWPYCCL